MSFLDKRHTKARTAPVDLRPPLLTEVQGSWLVNGGIIVGAVIRSAVIGIRTSDAKSNSHMKGRTNFVATALINTPSSLWTERLTTQAWGISLGAQSSDPSKASYDWQITAECATDEAGPLVRIRTPKYKMTDGELVNGKLHDTLRDNIVDRLTNGVGDASDLEAMLCRLSLKRLQMPSREAAPGDEVASFEALTELTLEEIRDLLPRLGFPVLSQAPGEQSWRLGLESAGTNGRATVSLVDLGDHRRASGTVEFNLTGNRVADLVAQQSAKTFATRLRSLITRDDPDAQWQATGPLAPRMKDQLS